MLRAVRSVVVVVAAVAVTASIVVVSSAWAATVPADHPYVAIGDSWAAGVGATPTEGTPTGCRQDLNNYPHVWAQNHPDFKLDDQTCSGATIDSVINGDDNQPSGQLTTLSARTELVTITIGGNDDGFVPTLRTCFGDTEARCKYETDYGSYAGRHWLADRLTSLYRLVQDKAPNARVIVLGYSQLLDPGEGSCGFLTPSPEARSHLINNANQFAEGIRDATARAGVTFIDMRYPFKGHEACSPDPFVIAADLSNQMFHPNRNGHLAYAYWLELETQSHPWATR